MEEDEGKEVGHLIRNLSLFLSNSFYMQHYDCEVVYETQRV